MESIGPYTVQSQIGNRLYKVTDSAGDVFALKIMAAGVPPPQHFLHPNVLKVHDAFYWHGDLFIVTPFMSAGSARSILESTFKNGLNEEYLRTVLDGVIKALCNIHDKNGSFGPIHGGKILIDDEGIVKLAPPMPPVISAAEITLQHKFEIFQFGQTAIELAVGPLEADELPAAIKDFSPHFRRIVRSCLDPNPSMRPTARTLSRKKFFSITRRLELKRIVIGLPPLELRQQAPTSIFRSMAWKLHGSSFRIEADEGQYAPLSFSNYPAPEAAPEVAEHIVDIPAAQPQICNFEKEQVEWGGWCFGVGVIQTLVGICSVILQVIKK